MSTLRERREAAGITQTRLAELSGVKRANISAYELGTRPMSAEMERRLLSCLVRPSERLRLHRSEVRRIIASHGGENPRVFGSVARNQDVPSSDIDLLIDATRIQGLDFIALEQELTNVLGVRIDLISERAVRLPKHAHILAEAVPL